jgi:DNA sulfur modification protein DndB
MDSRLLINDGQHRRKAIEEALKERPDLGHETISVVFFRDTGLERSQQMFSDLNKNALKPTKSLNILYDHRDSFSKFIVDLITSIKDFEGRVELEKTSISNRSSKVFTLNGISDATMRLLGTNKVKQLSSNDKKVIKDFWETLTKNIPQWQLVFRDEIKASELRKTYVNGHTNVLNVLGTVGRILYQKYPDNWKEKLSKLKDIDWERENPEWDGRLVIQGRMVKNATGIELAVNTILKKLGVKLDADRQKYEKSQ